LPPTLKNCTTEYEGGWPRDRNNSSSPGPPTLFVIPETADPAAGVGKTGYQ